MSSSSPRVKYDYYVAAAFNLLAASLQAHAENTEPDKTLNTVVVTGNRGSQPRTITDSPSPIDVISAEQLQASGKVGLKELLARLLPSFNLPAINGGGTSWSVRGVTMRGLSGDQVLVLVNGKRRHNTALINNLARIGTAAVPVNLDLIPVSAIDHIEVLRDGASAQYGSDAIAGVINIILKENDSGGSVETSFGRYGSGDGDTVHQTANYGLALPNDGFANLALDSKDQEPFDRTGSATGNLYSLPGFPDSRDQTVNRHGWNPSYGLGREKVTNVSYNLELPLQDDLRFYSFSTASYVETTKVTGNYRPNEITSLAGDPNTPYPDGIHAQRRNRSKDFQVAGGFKGEVGGWNYDASSTWGEDDSTLNANNTLNPSLGPTSPTEFNLASQIFDQWTNNLDFNRGFDIGLKNPLQTAFGFEYRWEKYQIEPGDFDSYTPGNYVIPSGPFAGRTPLPGLASYNGTSPTDSGEISRSNVASYVDLGLDVTDKWYVGAAARYEHYTQDIGSTWSGKFSTRYAFTDAFALRGTINNGFRAPSLAQTIYASSTFTSGGVVNGQQISVPVKVLPVDTPEAQALGAEKLKPEKSLNYSFGFTYEPTQNYRLTTDLYQIDIRDRIVSTSLLGGTTVSQILAANGLSPGLFAQYYTNAVDTRTRGVDIVNEFRQQLDQYGQVRWSAAYNWNQTKIEKIQDNPSQLSGSGLQLFDRRLQKDLTVATPQSKLILAANWKVTDYNLNLAVTRFGSYIEGDNNPVNDRKFSAKWITDLDAAYDLTKHLTVALGANNLFNVYPDKNGIQDWAGGYKYGQFSPFGFGGAYYYMRLAYNF
ncbi:TonB-dependent receptor plug domain-containing protein [Pseudomonas veronii]|uniref:TonB-dependent receptor plug domain-containing protein n=1 Tax=Pseudomonas veronii TaxID=76761 RepID=UPI002D785042|nr:TonB-dependent receptor [Pseudomonas veronii]WRU64957.1 TonB-dependent receptor [Pseudomonas veronii]